MFIVKTGHNRIITNVFRETAIIYDDEVDSVAHKIQIAHLIAREMVHQWLNIRMNPASWWSYHWLYEGLATLFGIDIINEVLFLYVNIMLFRFSIKTKCY